MVSEQPNVLLISVDSLRADQTSFCGGYEGTTPYLDELATDSTVFQRAITPATWTLPSHASLFTGLYPPEHGVLDRGDALGEIQTLAEILAERDYETRSYGYLEWFQLGGILRGFDHTNTSRLGNSDSESLSTRAIDRVLDTLGDRRWQVLELARSLSFSGFNRADHRTVDTVLADATEVNEPFCFFVHLNTVHWPYTPPTPYHRLFSDVSCRTLLANRSYWQQRIFFNRGAVASGEIEVPKTIQQQIREQYRGAIRQADDQIQRLLSGLSEHVDLEETVVVILGDHGDNIGEEGLFGHHFSVSDPLIRVPLLVHDPTETLDTGIRTDVVQTLDVFQTLMDLLDINIDRSQSTSLLSQEAREHAFTYYDPPNSFVDYVTSQSPRAADRATPKYSAWNSPEKKVIWLPEEETYQGASDGELRETLRNHYAALIENDRYHDSEGDVAQAAVKRLEQMGYL